MPWSELIKGNGWLLADFHGHLLSYWESAVAVEGMRAVQPQIEALAKRNRSKRCGVVTVFLDGFHIPEAGVRSEIVQIGPKLDDLVHGFGVIIPGTGFKAAALRAFVTGVAQLARTKYPVPTFADMAGADAWFRPRVTSAQDGWGADGELAKADAEIRAKYFPRRPQFQS